MLLDAIVLAGGRSSRLGGEPKQHLVVGGRSLVRRTVEAARAAGAQRIVVVGEPGLAAIGGVEVVREEPPFAGPAAAIAAGVAVLTADASQAQAERHGILVLACDMPGCGAAVPALVRAAALEAKTPRERAPHRPDGVVAVDATGRRQHLLALYDAAALGTAAERLGARADGAAVRALVERLELSEVVIPPGSADDVDTWDDAERLGARTPTEREEWR